MADIATSSSSGTEGQPIRPAGDACPAWTLKRRRSTGRGQAMTRNIAVAGAVKLWEERLGGLMVGQTQTARCMMQIRVLAASHGGDD